MRTKQLPTKVEKRRHWIKTPTVTVIAHTEGGVLRSSSYLWEESTRVKMNNYGAFCMLRVFQQLVHSCILTLRRGISMTPNDRKADEGHAS